jgi:hypothetical protein
MAKFIRTFSDAWLHRHRETHAKHALFGTHRHPYLHDTMRQLAAAVVAESGEAPSLLDYGCGKAPIERLVRTQPAGRFRHGQAVEQRETAGKRGDVGYQGVEEFELDDIDHVEAGDEIVSPLGPRLERLDRRNMFVYRNNMSARLRSPHAGAARKAGRRDRAGLLGDEVDHWLGTGQYASLSLACFSLSRLGERAGVRALACFSLSRSGESAGVRALACFSRRTLGLNSPGGKSGPGATANIRQSGRKMRPTCGAARNSAAISGFVSRYRTCPPTQAA